MAYFSNGGSEGEAYEAEWCDKCIHQGNGCAVWLAHLLHNYDECNNKDSILHLLIPRTDDGNGRCRMFLDSTLLSPLARQKFTSEEAADLAREAGR